MYLLDVLLCELYGKDGYYIRWDSTKCRLIADGARCGITPSFVNEFIGGCCRCSYFDKRVFKAFSVLTSAGVQKRYIRMFNSRQEIRIIKDYWVLDCSNTADVPQGSLNKIVFIGVNGTENPFKSTDNSVNEIKLNEIKISDDDGGNARVRELFKALWDREPTTGEYSLIEDMYISLGGLNDGNCDLLEQAMLSASLAGEPNLKYVSGCFRNFRRRGIKSNNDYWEYEVNRDKEYMI